MSGLDLGILVIAVMGALLGMKIGAVSAFFNIVGGFVGSWASSRYYVSLLDIFSNSPAMAYMAVFVLAAGSFVVTGIIMSHILERFFLGLLDKFLGAVLGMGLSLVMVTVMLIPFLLNQNPATQDLFQRSTYAPHMVRFSQNYFQIAPKILWVKIEPLLELRKMNQVRQLLEERIR